MAKAKTKANEEILKDDDVAGTTEETTAPAEATEGENVVGPDVAETPTPKDDMVEIVVPRFLFTSDIYSTHHEFCVNGKIYQVVYDEPVKVPEIVANVARDAIAQRRKVQGLIKAMDGKSKELDIGELN